MKYGTLCSGIETASVAFRALKWQLKWTAEIDPYCCDLIEQRYGVKNYGDITKIQAVDSVDLIVAGTPCQSFSVQGSQRGMDDPRGKLATSFHDVVRIAAPRWVVWENVPGVLRTNGGRDFKLFLRGLAELGYGIAYRVLDAQHFGTPQRRRRVFVVGHSGEDWQRAAAVLFEYQADRPIDSSSSQVLRRRKHSFASTTQVLGWTGDETPKHGIEVVPTLRSQQGGEGVGIVNGTARKLTIREWERLQGLPDDYTQLDGWSDHARRKAIGNSFCVPVLRWIGERIAFVQGVVSKDVP